MNIFIWSLLIYWQYWQKCRDQSTCPRQFKRLNDLLYGIIACFIPPALKCLKRVLAYSPYKTMDWVSSEPYPLSSCIAHMGPWHGWPVLAQADLAHIYPMWNPPGLPTPSPSPLSPYKTVTGPRCGWPVVAPAHRAHTTSIQYPTVVDQI